MAFGLGPMLTMGAIEALDRARHARTLKAPLPRKARLRRMDGDHEPHRAAGGLRSRRAAHPRRAGAATAPTASPGRRSSSPTASTISPTTSCISCSRACPMRRAGTRGISLFLVPKFSGPTAAAQRRALPRHRAQARHPRLADLHDDLRRRVGASRRVGWLVGEENRGLACMFTMMNNARLDGRHAGRRPLPSAPTSRRSPMRASAGRAARRVRPARA